jgi:hypothetical protein
MKVASTVRGGGLRKAPTRVTRLAPTLLHAAGHCCLQLFRRHNRKTQERQGRNGGAHDLVQGHGLGTPGRAGCRISGEGQAGLRRGAVAP